MKRLIRFGSALFALLFCFGTLLCFASCRKQENDAPDGMMTASCAGADYRLYVPTTWNLNTFYGISGAYYTLNEQSTVSVNRYPIDSKLETDLAEKDDRNAAFWELKLLPDVRSRALEGDVTEYSDDAVATVLDGVNAARRHVSALVDGKTLHFLHVVAERKGAFYVFTFIAGTDLYAFCMNNVEKMLTEFRFSDEPYYPEDYAWKPEKDENVPDGMQVAYSKDVAYRFYVPAAWKINADHAIYAAYDPDDRTNVSVVPYLPEIDGMSVAEFFTLCNNQLEKTAGIENYQLIGSKEVTLGGRKATDYEYTCTVSGTDYRFRQIIAVYKSMVYSLTYTATEEHYAEHLGELEQIVSAFAFR